MPPQNPALRGTRDISGPFTPTTDEDGFALNVTNDSEVTLTGTANGGWTPGRSALWFWVEAGTLELIGDTDVTISPAGLAQAEEGRFVLARYTRADLWVLDGFLPNLTGPTVLGRTSGLGPPVALTPAQARGIAQVAGPEFDVTHPDFGAVGNNVADDTAAILAAIAAADAVGGGVVHFPFGLGYKSSPFTVPANVHLRGDGPGLSAIAFKAGGAGPMITTESDADACVISDLSIVGTGASSGTQAGILLTRTGSPPYDVGYPRHVVRNVVVRDVGGVGVHISGSPAGAVLHNVNCQRTGSHGFQVAGSDAILSDCVSGEAGEAGSGNGFDVTAGGIQATNCKAFGSASNGFRIRGSGAGLYVGCYSQECAGFGWSIGNTFTNAVVLAGCGSDSDQTAGFRFDTCTGVIAVGLIVTATAGRLYTPVHGFSFGANVIGCRIDGVASGFDTAASTGTPSGGLITINGDLLGAGNFTTTNVTTDRSYDANATTLDELADVLGTLIADLKTAGVLP